MNDLLEQLKQHCICMNKKDEQLERALERALSLFSTFTCGNNIGMKRVQERIRVEKQCTCSCTDNYMTFFTFYPNPRNYTVTIETIEGITRTVEPTDFLEVVEGELKIDLSKIPCNNCRCDENFLIVEYDAFYDLIPDDLIPFFCDLMNALLIIQKSSCGTCEKCKNFRKQEIYQLLEEMNEDAKMIVNSLDKVIYGYYERILKKYSLCRRIKVFGVKAGGK